MILRVNDEHILFADSLWFREFFRTFLPQAIKHEGKTSKVDNCAAVVFNIQRARNSSNKYLYRIQPESIEFIVGGFQSGKKEKKKK